jgi:hypothetical protein
LDVDATGHDETMNEHGHSTRLLTYIWKEAF